MSQGNAIMLVIRHCGAIMSMGTGIPVLATRAQIWKPDMSLGTPTSGYFLGIRFKIIAFG